ncbi:beta-lactamase domain-containing protein 2-like [Saccostrea echinata]|uniref:beta-lactamase domain-containing protein 2-like n=1 Tax=Saccostrea echinata TaxID=191078 RepID=UPI002A80673B|nr:beta-lactamase domain-containing protein 2-like [Saccostrea echinata]XP_061192457.1 beta-lactamase domain-containing protein 2-like [Saccostrea echinata]
MGGRLTLMKTMSQPHRKQPIHIDGFVKPGFEKVLEVFRYNLENDIERGGTFAAYYRGELVVNIWGGYADRKSRVKWKKDLMPCFYSTTKSPSATVIAHLVDRGFLDYSERVCKYWPEFAANGKEDITLETLVTNRAGLSCTEEKFTMAMSKDDPDKLGRILANQKPLWTPGTNHGYHPITFALYLDQIVRRVDPQKRSLSQYFYEEMAVPFDLDFHIGLPYEKQYRAPRIVMMKSFDQEEYIRNFKGDLSILQLTGGNPTDFIGVRRMNDPDIRVLPVGSVCGHGTAESMAKFHAILGEGGVWQGKRLLSQDSVDRFQRIKSGGYDLAFSMDGMWSYGMMIFPVMEQGKPTMFMFGHGGYGGQMGLADTTYRVGLAYATSHLDPTSRPGADADKRWPSMYNALYKCIYQIENIRVPRKTLYLYEDYKKAQSTSKM